MTTKSMKTRSMETRSVSLNSKIVVKIVMKGTNYAF